MVNTDPNFFNNANEWLHRDVDGDGNYDITMAYDEVGNMTSDGEDYDYEYDAFGRLRYVYATGTSDVVAEYRYNGLNQRITAHYDTDSDNDVDGSDTVQHFAYDSRWRMLARFEDSDTDPVEQWVYHHAGLVATGSGSYIDSVILRDRDTYTSGAPDGTLDERVYYLQNWRNDTVALITDAGAQVEQVRYEPYGSPFGIPAGDVDASGTVDGTDLTAVTAWYNAPSYDVRGDLDMDGDIDTTDLALLEDAKDAAATLGLYQLSTVDNRKGYAGYELLGELSEAKWDVRNRVLNSRLGGWNRRDPLGYVDGMSLLLYSTANPITLVDPMGWSPWVNWDFLVHYMGNTGISMDLSWIGRDADYKSHEAVIAAEAGLLIPITVGIWA